MGFKEKWLESVERKNSIICAGLDPAEYELGCGEKGLPAGADKLVWAKRFLEAVGPYVAGVKPNFHFWTREREIEQLHILVGTAHSLDLPVILDFKIADIGSTNNIGLYHAKELGVDAVTFSPFAGNLEQSVVQAHEYGIGLISMCLMSNPGFARQKNALFLLEDEEKSGYRLDDQINFDGLGKSYVRHYVKLAHDAQKYGADGVVVGVTNHVTAREVAIVAHHFKGLSLSPGLGAQGGAAGAVIHHFGDRVIANVGRGLMFPQGSGSTPEDQAAAAKHYMDELNDLRTL